MHYAPDGTPIRPRLGLARDAASILGVSSGRVRQLDAQLSPIISPSGGRIYDLSHVAAYAAARRARR